MYTGMSDGVTATVSPTHSGAHINQELPATYSIDCVGSVKLTGRARQAAEPVLGQSFFFPMERDELEAMKSGRRTGAVVPVLPDLAERLKPGTSVTFYEAIPDPSGDAVPAQTATD